MSAFLLAAWALAAPAEPLKPTSLQTQKVGGDTWFMAIVALPDDAVRDVFAGDISDPAEARVRVRGRQPRAFATDGKTAAAQVALEPLMDGKHEAYKVYGRVIDAKGTATIRLSYPRARKAATGYAALVADRDRGTTDVFLDWTKATTREGSDIKWHHARNVALSLDYLAGQSVGRGPAGLLSELHRDRTDSKWRPDVAERDSRKGMFDAFAGFGSDNLFELTTGATALSETLALQRVQDRATAKEAATVALAKIPGIDVAAHDWKKMTGDRKPRPELLAGLVPEDNWYFTATDVRSFVAAWEVIDTWGGSVLRPPTLQDRDGGVRARYERQLCLPPVEMLKRLPKDNVRSLALTGSDLFWAVGSDVTALIETADPAAFVKAHDAVIAVKSGVKRSVIGEITSFVSPRREVSLHRAVIGNVVVCANSAAALNRVLAVRDDKLTALGKALDFKYMRTIFERDAKTEDGFVFLSDAFVRRLVSPRTRILMARRNAARDALNILSHAAMLASRDTGTIPDTAGILAHAKLDAKAVNAVWDADRGQAVSEAFGTLEFMTPLAEMDIDMVTPSEERMYQDFRTDYLRLWRRFFDPVGMRWSLGPGPTKVEVYLLPLVNNSVYNDLRWRAGGGLMTYSPSALPKDTVFHARSYYDLGGNNFGIGNWLMMHLGNAGFDLAPLVKWGIRADMTRTEANAFDIPPVLFGVGVTDRKKAADLIKMVYDNWLAPEKPKVTAETFGDLTVNVRPIKSDVLGSNLNVPTVADLLTDDGLYLSFVKSQTVEFAKAHAALKKEKPKDAVETNTALVLSPPSGKNAEALGAFVEWETHKRALGSAAVWQTLYDANVVTATMTAADRDRVARRLLGYVPVSPDGTAFVYDADTRTVRNERHGSPAVPTFRGTISENSGAVLLLNQLRRFRADLRFREDGIHTTMTLEWNGTRK